MHTWSMEIGQQRKEEEMQIILWTLSKYADRDVYFDGTGWTLVAENAKRFTDRGAADTAKSTQERELGQPVYLLVAEQ